MVKHKETESEAESVSHVEELHFRIAVCMKRFYSDHRARALLYVSARRRVRWLQCRLRRLFALPSALVLLCRGHLLPLDEPLALLDRDDLVEVVPGPAEPSVDVAKEPELDDLSESKRRALLVLDQYCGGEQASPPEGTLRLKRRRVRRRRRPPTATEHEHSLQVSDEEPSLGSTSAVFREPDTAETVQRNELRPRAPRLVRDVSRCDVLTCDVLLSDESLSAVAHVTPFTKIFK